MLSWKNILGGDDIDEVNWKCLNHQDFAQNFDLK